MKLLILIFVVLILVGCNGTFEGTTEISGKGYIIEIFCNDENPSTFMFKVDEIKVNDAGYYFTFEGKKIITNCPVFIKEI